MSRLLIPVLMLISGLTACNQAAKSDAEPGPVSEDSLRVKADSLIAISFDTLRNSLVRAAAEKGFANAVAYCKLNAPALLATYNEENVTVTRTSLRLRNPQNRPDSIGEEVLREFERSNERGEKPVPQLKKDLAGNYRYYKPIFIQPFCLNCHGSTATGIASTTLDTIRQLYPSDAAVNYRDAEIRGTWFVLFRSADKD